MRGLKITVTLRNEIPNQPPFGFSLLLIETGRNFALQPELIGAAAKRIDIDDFTLDRGGCIEAHHYWESQHPVGYTFTEQATVSMTLRDKITGKTLKISQIIDHCDISHHDDLSRVVNAGRGSGKSVPLIMDDIDAHDNSDNLIKLINFDPTCDPEVKL